MQSITYQPQLRRALPLVYGPKEYREQRDLFIRLDGLLHQSDLEHEFIKLSMEHRKIDLAEQSAKQAKNISQRGEDTELTPGQIKQISKRVENILDQLLAAIKQAHERIIGGRKLVNKEKILSFYDPDVQVIKRGKVMLKLSLEITSG
jgi:hypothetical protein